MAKKELTSLEQLHEQLLKDRRNALYKPFVAAITRGEKVRVPYNCDVLTQVSELYNYHPFDLKIVRKQ